MQKQEDAKSIRITCINDIMRIIAIAHLTVYAYAVMIISTFNYSSWKERKPVAVLPKINMGVVICFSSLKGGVGKTTTVHNISVQLAKLNKKTLVIDLDPSGNLSEAFGFDRDDFKKNSVCNMFPLEDEENDPVAIYETHLPNLTMIPSVPKLGNYRTKLKDQFRCEYILKESIDTIRDNYDYILVDTSPAMDILVTNAYVASDYLIIPTECTKKGTTGYRDAIRFYNTCHARKLNTELKYLGIIVTKFRSNSRSQAVINEEYLETGEVIQQVVLAEDATRGDECGESAIESSPYGKVASAYRMVTNKIITMTRTTLIVSK